ncbi:MAG: hypothetical protein CL878_10960 [Dehalococcoidia bacterium]|nr:hypothetical protein [Dehalococcoidia bacterium]
MRADRVQRVTTVMKGAAFKMRKNPGLAKLRAGGVTAGPGVSFGSPDLAEQAASIGFEWVWLDWQHGQWTESVLNNALARFLAFETAPIVRVKGHEPGTINRVLDMGAMGVIVPMIQNAEQARSVAQAAYYPPPGMRSVGGMRLGLYAGGVIADYQQQANDEIMLVVMVETEEAIGNVTEIMQVPGVDVVLIGPGDLMIDVKANGHDAARHEELVLQVAAASKATGTAAGYVCSSREEANARVGHGFRFIVHGSDRLAVQTAFGEALADSKNW